MPSDSQPDAKALRAALDFLKPRDRFQEEVRRHLLGKGYPAYDVESVVQLLAERRLLNDDRTTQNLIEQSAGKRAVGIERLRADLEGLGAQAETIERHIEQLGKREPERALEALRAQYRPGANRAKAGRFLFARGFDEESVESALDAFCGESPSSD